MQTDFKRDNYSRIVKYADRYSTLYENNFELRYFNARSFFETGNYNDAKELYEWLLNNWKIEQKVVTWEVV